MEPLRDCDGFCVECWPGEVGLIVGEITGKFHEIFLGVSRNYENFCS